MATSAASWPETVELSAAGPETTEIVEKATFGLIEGASRLEGERRYAEWLRRRGRAGLRG